MASLSNAAYLRCMFPHIFAFCILACCFADSCPDCSKPNENFRAPLTSKIPKNIAHTWHTVISRTLRKTKANNTPDHVSIISRPAHGRSAKSPAAMPMSFVCSEQEICLEELRSHRADCVENGVTVEGYENKPNNEGVIVQLSDGTTREADLLVGADGIWSKVRAQMYNQEARGDGSGTTYSGMPRPSMCKYRAAAFDRRHRHRDHSSCIESIVSCTLHVPHTKDFIAAKTSAVARAHLPSP